MFGVQWSNNKMVQMVSKNSFHAANSKKKRTTYMNKMNRGNTYYMYMDVGYIVKTD